MNSIDYETYKVEYEHNNRTILDGNFTNMTLMIYKGNYGAVNYDYTLLLLCFWSGLQAAQAYPL